MVFLPVLKLLKMAKGIRALLDTVMQALPQVGNLGLLFFLLFFIFAALGVELFGRLGMKFHFIWFTYFIKNNIHSSLHGDAPHLLLFISHQFMCFLQLCHSIESYGFFFILMHFDEPPPPPPIRTSSSHKSDICCNSILYQMCSWYIQP